MFPLQVLSALMGLFYSKYCFSFWKLAKKKMVYQSCVLLFVIKCRYLKAKFEAKFYKQTFFLYPIFPALCIHGQVCVLPACPGRLHLALTDMLVTVYLGRL